MKLSRSKIRNEESMSGIKEEDGDEMWGLVVLVVDDERERSGVVKSGCQT